MFSRPAVSAGGEGILSRGWSAAQRSLAAAWSGHEWSSLLVAEAGIGLAVAEGSGTGTALAGGGAIVGGSVGRRASGVVGWDLDRAWDFIEAATRRERASRFWALDACEERKTGRGKGAGRGRESPRSGQ